MKTGVTPPQPSNILEQFVSENPILIAVGVGGLFLAGPLGCVGALLLYYAATIQLKKAQTTIENLNPITAVTHKAQDLWEGITNLFSPKTPQPTMAEIPQITEPLNAQAKTIDPTPSAPIEKHGGYELIETTTQSKTVDATPAAPIEKHGGYELFEYALNLIRGENNKDKESEIILATPTETAPKTRSATIPAVIPTPSPTPVVTPKPKDLSVSKAATRSRSSSPLRRSKRLAAIEGDNLQSEQEQVVTVTPPVEKEKQVTRTKPVNKTKPVPETKPVAETKPVPETKPVAEAKPKAKKPVVIAKPVATTEHLATKQIEKSAAIELNLANALVKYQPLVAQDASTPAVAEMALHPTKALTFSAQPLKPQPTARPTNFEEANEDLDPRCRQNRSCWQRFMSYF